ncbi:MADS-box protein JOINTLESS-like isoform X5 [Corylus avellana]|uniref:MADS-box protein JOINTLESS-like isoform X5 n=1 Tax=Corylus avellana TaxID=13451 RepID=UPI00286A5F56|nr:MADS-box protein JOINTLESS-like isoform X5 [Corylus avellana]
MHSKNLDQPSLELQLENRACTSLSNEIMDKTRELRQMMGEELQGLNMEELKKLEELEEGLSRVLKAKDERFLEEMSALERKVSQLMQDNQQLKQQMEKQFNIKTHAIEQGQSSESITNICSSADPLQDQDNNDTSLKLGTGPRLELKASKEPPGQTPQLENSRLESLAETENVCDFFEDLKHRFLRFKKRKFKENLEILPRVKHQSFIRSWVVVGNNARLITKSAASNLSFDQQCVQTLRRNQSTIPCQICSLTHG